MNIMPCILNDYNAILSSIHPDIQLSVGLLKDDLSVYTEQLQHVDKIRSLLKRAGYKLLRKVNYPGDKGLQAGCVQIFKLP